MYQAGQQYFLAGFIRSPGRVTDILSYVPPSLAVAVAYLCNLLLQSSESGGPTNSTVEYAAHQHGTA